MWNKQIAKEFCHGALQIPVWNDQHIAYIPWWELINLNRYYQSPKDFRQCKKRWLMSSPLPLHEMQLSGLKDYRSSQL